MENPEGKIRRFIAKNFLFTVDSTSLSGDTSFLEKGIVDSTGVLEIVNYLEETFAFKVEDDEIIPENMDSINRIVRYLGKKLSHPSASAL